MKVYNYSVELYLLSKFFHLKPRSLTKVESSSIRGPNRVGFCPRPSSHLKTELEPSSETRGLNKKQLDIITHILLQHCQKS
jgi:hypothetical protein